MSPRNLEDLLCMQPNDIESIVELRFNEPLYSEVLFITHNTLCASNREMCRKEPRLIETWPFVKLRFHCS